MFIGDWDKLMRGKRVICVFFFDELVRGGKVGIFLCLCVFSWSCCWQLWVSLEVISFFLTNFLSICWSFYQFDGFSVNLIDFLSIWRCFNQFVGVSFKPNLGSKSLNFIKIYPSKLLGLASGQSSLSPVFTPINEQTCLGSQNEGLLQPSFTSLPLILASLIYSPACFHLRKPCRSSLPLI
jgi:hypothetical protein